MNNQNNPLLCRHAKIDKEEERRALPFVIEFVKFAVGFVFIIAVALLALLALGAATAALQ